MRHHLLFLERATQLDREALGGSENNFKQFTASYSVVGILCVVCNVLSDQKEFNWLKRLCFMEMALSDAFHGYLSVTAPLIQGLHRSMNNIYHNLFWLYVFRSCLFIHSLVVFVVAAGNIYRRGVHLIPERAGRTGQRSVTTTGHQSSLSRTCRRGCSFIRRAASCVAVLLLLTLVAGHGRSQTEKKLMWFCPAGGVLLQRMNNLVCELDLGKLVIMALWRVRIWGDIRDKWNQNARVRLG